MSSIKSSKSTVPSKSQNNKQYVAACAQGNLQKIQYLLFQAENKADINYKDGLALSQAARYGQLEVLDFLFKKTHESPEKIGTFSNVCNAISVGAMSGNLKVLDCLFDYIHENLSLNAKESLKSMYSQYIKELKNIVNIGVSTPDLKMIDYVFKNAEIRKHTDIGLLAHEVFSDICAIGTKEIYAYMMDNFVISPYVYLEGFSQASQYGNMPLLELMYHPKIAEDTLEIATNLACQNKEKEAVLFLSQKSSLKFINEQYINEFIKNDEIEFAKFLILEIAAPLDMNFFKENAEIFSLIEKMKLNENLTTTLENKSTSHKQLKI